MSSPQGVPPFLGSEFPEEDFQQIRDILLERCDIDLNMYKDRCIKRRIATRVRARGYTDAAGYARLLRDNSDELRALVEALTIHVSQFFRNPSTFAALESMYLPQLFDRARQEKRRQVDFWSVGCAGGEEPYSLALLLEEMHPTDLELRLLGTDISQAILDRAQQGFFEPQRLRDVPERVLDNYFCSEKGGYRLKKRIKDRVEFKRHDILNESAFCRADLILCRNVLIYFSRNEQEKILGRFAASLPESGILVLGKAETLVGETRELFRAVEPAERIYLRTA